MRNWNVILARSVCILHVYITVSSTVHLMTRTVHHLDWGAASLAPISQSQGYFTTGGLPPISSSWRQDPRYSRTAIFSQLNTCGYSPYVTSSLTRGLICRLQLLLILVGVVILGSESCGTHGHILLSQIWDYPTWRESSPYLIPPGTGWPS
jgi:hypothetical protein